LLSGLDLPAVMIASCNGAQTFFPLMRAIYKDQVTWVEKFQSTPREQLEQLETLGPNQLPLQAAKFAGLQDWAAARGVPPARSTQCLTDAAKVDKLVQNSQAVTNEFPQFPGTPSFILNGKMLEQTATWATLEPKLREALR
jgi:protein-disulfide isomerase